VVLAWDIKNDSEFLGKCEKMKEEFIESVKAFIDRNSDNSRGILTIMTDNEGNVSIVYHGISPFEKIAIAQWLERMTWRTITTKAVTDEDDEPTPSRYVS